MVSLFFVGASSVTIPKDCYGDRVSPLPSLPVLRLTIDIAYHRYCFAETAHNVPPFWVLLRFTFGIVIAVGSYCIMTQGNPHFYKADIQYPKVPLLS